MLDYCRGSDRRVFCLDFVQKSGIKKIVEGLREHTVSSDACHAVNGIEDCDHPWSFRAEHVHSSDEVVVVLHIACDLSHTSHDAKGGGDACGVASPDGSG